MSKQEETLFTETLGIEAQSVEVLPIVGTVKVKRDPMKKSALTPRVQIISNLAESRGYRNNQ